MTNHYIGKKMGENKKIIPGKKEPEVGLINGPNLNMLGKREPEIYGNETLEEINLLLKARAEGFGIKLNSFQSNYEGALVEKIHQAYEEKWDGIIINPGAYTHTSVAIRDALLILSIPIIEVHISNIHKRDDFRQRSLISDVASGQIIGFGAAGYEMALDALDRIFCS